MIPVYPVDRDLQHGDKPPFGSLCNRCGLCCLAGPCVLGAHVFGGEAGRCPALITDDAGAYACGLVATPRAFAPVRAARYGVGTLSKAAAMMIGAGDCCDSELLGEIVPPSVKAAVDAKWIALGRRMDAAFRVWGVDPMDC